MKDFTDDEVIDYLLSSLAQKGPSNFSLYFELEERYGRSFAEGRVSFFSRALEYHRLARQDPSDMIFRLTGAGKLILKWGGWLKYLQMRAEAAHREYLKRQCELEQKEEEKESKVDRQQYVKRKVEVRQPSVTIEKSVSKEMTLPDLTVFFLLGFIFSFFMMYYDIHG